MAYDYAGSWSDAAGHSADLYANKALGSVDSTQNWLDYPESQYQNIAAGME
jgi:GH18 family chitinase